MTTRRDPEIAGIYSSWKVSKKLRRLKERAIEYKGGKCIKCGYNKCNISLVFHHRDPKEKEYSISRKVTTWEVIQIELDKCDLLCLNCHGEVHEAEYQKKLAEKEEFVRSKIPERICKGIKSFICKYCHSAFKGYNNRKYCSYKCKADALRKIPNTQSELQSLVNEKPLNVIATEIGVSVRAIHKACKAANVNIPKYGPVAK